MKRLASGLKEYIKRHNIEKDSAGNLILYKAVLRNFGSWWVRRFKYQESFGAYRPGALVRNGRDPIRSRKRSCGEGLHVGTLNCAYSFTRVIACPWKIIKVSVNPYNVINVPYMSLALRAYIYEKIIVKELIVTEVVAEGRE
jgi:hypothetical protein